MLHGLTIGSGPVKSNRSRKSSRLRWLPEIPRRTPACECTFAHGQRIVQRERNMLCCAQWRRCGRWLEARRPARLAELCNVGESDSALIESDDGSCDEQPSLWTTPTGRAAAARVQASEDTWHRGGDSVRDFDQVIQAGRAGAAPCDATKALGPSHPRSVGRQIWIVRRGRGFSER